MNPIKRLNLWIYKNINIISRLLDVWIVIFLILLISLLFGKLFRQIITLWSSLGIIFLYVHYLYNWYYKGKRRPKGKELEQIQSISLPTKLDIWIITRRKMVIGTFFLYLMVFASFCILYFFGLSFKFVVIWYLFSLIFVYPLFVIYWHRTGELYELTEETNDIGKG